MIRGTPILENGNLHIREMHAAQLCPLCQTLFLYFNFSCRGPTVDASHSRGGCVCGCGCGCGGGSIGFISRFAMLGMPLQCGLTSNSCAFPTG